MDGDTFYRNVFLLTQAVPPSKEFIKHFKEGMFDKPNTVGFQHVAHYLLTIYDPERCKKNVQWPLLCKQSESKYRSDVKDFITLIAHENPDVDFPQILASHLLHASGSKFNSIMANLSTVVMRTWIKNEGEPVLYVPKSKAADDISRTMLNNLISQNTKIVDEGNEIMSKNNEKAKEFAKELEESIPRYSDELFQSRQNLITLSSKAPVHQDVKGRLVDLNDTEIVPLWERSVDESIQLLKEKQVCLKTLSELSTDVANMIGSIVSNDKNILDGKRLLGIKVDQLSEIKDLSPQTQVMLCRLYEDETLELKKFLSVFNLILTDLRRFIEKYEFPDLSQCASQISASCEDMKSMSDLFHAMYDRVIELASHSESSSNQEDILRNYPHQYSIDNDLLNSVLLKRSPAININWNPETNGNEFHDRLELTPVEHIHRALFSRHRRNNDGKMQASKLRPTILISRINFDDTRDTSISEKLSPLTGNVSSRPIDRWNAYRDGTYSRIFSTLNKRPSRRLNYSVRAGSSSSHQNSTMCDVYNASELRAHLGLTNKYAENTNICSPKKFTPTKNNDNNRASSTIIEDEKSLKSTELSELVEEGDKENKMELGRSPASQKQFRSPTKTEKPLNKRLSISDLVERYRKIRDKSVDVTIGMNFSSDDDGNY